MNPQTNIKLDKTPAAPALQVVSNNGSKNLPGFATVNDIREVVEFLKRHGDGVTIIQALDSLRKRAFDQRKLEAYESWGIVVRNSDRIRLTDLGWEMARLRAREADFFRRLLAQNPTYWLTLEWIHKQGMSVVSCVELSSFWRSPAVENLQFTTDDQIESSAGSFLQLCHTADVGVLLVGRKGQPTRLHINTDELSRVLNGDTVAEINSPTFELLSGAEAQCIRADFKSTRQRVFISSTAQIDSINRMLEIFTLAAVDYEFTCSSSGERTAMAENLDQMKCCDTAILIITRNACDHRGELSSTTLLELGAAILHFNSNLALLVENGVSLPPNIPVRHHPFDNDLSWELVVEMLSFVRQIENCE